MHISVVTLYVKDIDRAIDFYTNKLGWQKTMDAPMGEGMRWVTVAPGPDKTCFALMPEDEEDKAGESGVIIETDDVFKTCDQLTKKGVSFEEKPRVEPWGGWARFRDSEGNILGLHSPAPAGVSAN